jgi:hypothetical protein
VRTHFPARTATLHRGEWLALAAAIVIAHLFYWRVVRYPSAWDAQTYLDIASDIERNGLFRTFHKSALRPYGYPLLLSVLLRAASALGAPVGFVVFEFQLALYLIGAVFVRRRIAQLWPAAAPWAFAGVVLNVFILSYLPESLTESVSLALILIAAGCWLALLAAREPPWRDVLMGSLAMGAAVVVRPANLFALAAWCLAVAAICVARRPWPSRLSVALALAGGVAFPLVPQYVNNVWNYGRHTPLIVESLAHNQQTWGLDLKYATGMPPVPVAPIWYFNPLKTGSVIDPEQPLTWYAQNPLRGTLTLALHVFNMLDQDLFFVYSRDLDPWYRIPVGLVNHAVVALALIAAGLLLARTRRDRTLVLPTVALAAYVLCHLAMHVTTLVEMRFGLPLLLIAGPAALLAIRDLAERRSWRPRAMAAAFVAVWVVAALLLSQWVRQQAPAIRDWEAARSGFDLN